MLNQQDATKLSLQSSFTLLGEKDKERLAFNGSVVCVNELEKAGFRLGTKYRDPCLICSPTESKRIWHEVSLSCNNVEGSIWFCSNCSRAYLHKKRGSEIWAELLKTLKPYSNDSEEYRSPSNIVYDYLPNKEDFETAYRTLTRPGETISIDLVLDQMQINAMKKDLSLKNNWRIITEKNIEIWSKKG